MLEDFHKLHPLSSLSFPSVKWGQPFITTQPAPFPPRELESSLLSAIFVDSQPRGSWSHTHHVLGGRLLDHVGAGHLEEQPLGNQGVPGLLPEVLQLPCQELAAPLCIR